MAYNDEVWVNGKRKLGSHCESGYKSLGKKRIITKIKFKNFKVLRDTELPLGQFTLIVGPNGSGKSTVFQALRAVSQPENYGHENLVTVGVSDVVEVMVSCDAAVAIQAVWDVVRQCGFAHRLTPRNTTILDTDSPDLERRIKGCRAFSFNPAKIAAPVTLEPNIELTPQGGNLAGVLDGLRDKYPERFDALNQELSRWLPEFDRILFETPRTGQRAICLRTKSGGYSIKASDLSQGSLIALAMLTLAYLPYPPPLVFLEEPDHSLHPRLLRDVRDALYRLAYPESFGEKREPVQVIATTHNPYFLDLFHEHPEEIVIAEKLGLEARFSRLIDRTDLKEILGDAHLGDVWYSGLLGGVPAGT